MSFCFVFCCEFEMVYNKSDQMTPFSPGKGECKIYVIRKGALQSIFSGL